jgi:hypothetical protein
LGDGHPAPLKGAVTARRESACRGARSAPSGGIRRPVP